MNWSATWTRLHILRTDRRNSVFSSMQKGIQQKNTETRLNDKNMILINFNLDDNDETSLMSINFRTSRYCTSKVFQNYERKGISLCPIDNRRPNVWDVDFDRFTLSFLISVSTFWSLWLRFGASRRYYRWYEWHHPHWSIQSWSWVHP